ncbi:hypothetical protein NDK50_15230 [Paraburkholderia bryophila]|uniref:hypothetical protein n=1 Tax=Paraburkholderia bryophila TaxID=420952 RepID=UPI00234AC611|nr:hypothetical protein [Paraburkholderia bryophila]WCM18779.1 hypothetical protein NDK50_15230 [Paraburkholderia bryophila]
MNRTIAILQAFSRDSGESPVRATGRAVGEFSRAISKAFRAAIEGEMILFISDI